MCLSTLQGVYSTWYAIRHLKSLTDVLRESISGMETLDTNDLKIVDDLNLAKIRQGKILEDDHDNLAHLLEVILIRKPYAAWCYRLMRCFKNIASIV